MILLLIFIFFFITRTTNLTLLPLFNDESIYINFGQKMIADPNNRFYSLFDGKQPLLMWLFGISANIFSDPALAGRFISILFSVTTFIGIYLLSKKLLNKPYLYLPIIIYTITPIFLFFDRQALMEGPLSAISVWSLYSVITLTETKKIRFAFLLGLILGIGLFIKSTTLLFAISVFVYLIYSLIKSPSIKSKNQIMTFIFVIIITCLIILFPLISAPQFSQIILRGDRFNLTFSEIIKLPIGLWLKNLINLIIVSFWQLTPPVLILSVTGLLIIILKRKNLILVYWTLLPIIIAIITARRLNTRYSEVLLPMTTITSSYTIYYFYKRFKKLTIFLSSTLIIPAYILILLITNPISYFNLLNAVTTEFSQKNGYVTDDTSGYGIKETVDYLKSKAKEGPILIGVRLDAGNPENAILAYFFNNKKIQATYFDKQMFPDDFDFKLLKPKLPVYFVSRSQHQGGLEEYLVEEKRFYKPEGKSYFGVYRFNND